MAAASRSRASRAAEPASLSPFRSSHKGTGVSCLLEFPMIDRRQFIGAAAAASTASLMAQQTFEWGGPALDIHLHLRADGESNVAHIEGSGVTKAVLLTRAQDVDRAK